MKSRLFTCAMLLVLPLSQSCSQAKYDGVGKDGIYVSGPYRDGSKFKIVVSSKNQDFDCINLNGINGSGEFLKSKGSKGPSISKSTEFFRKSDIAFYDNNSVERLVNIYRNSEEIFFDRNYNYIMMPIFNCKKFTENTPQYVYIYTLPSL